MRASLYWTIGILLQLASIILFLIGIIAILYPVVLIGGSLIVIIAIILLITYPYDLNQFHSSLPHKLDHKPKNLWIARVNEIATTRRLYRALLIALSAMIFSFGLMSFLKVHSWLFYIRPLSQELEPFRQVYISGKNRFKPLQDSFKEKPKTIY